MTFNKVFACHLYDVKRLMLTSNTSNQTECQCQPPSYRLPAQNEEILALKSNPVQLLRLTARNGARIVCSAISDSAEWVAYADIHTIRLFQITVVGGG